MTISQPAGLGYQRYCSEVLAQLAQTLHDAGPDVPVPSPLPDGTTVFSARRMTHETVVHRADATLALGVEFTLDKQVGRDAIEECLAR